MDANDAGVLRLIDADNAFKRRSFVRMRQLVQQPVTGDQDPSLAIIENELYFITFEHDIEGNRNGAEANGGKIRYQKLGPVGKKERYSLPFLQILFLQCRTQTTNLVIELRVCHRNASTQYD